MSENLKIWNAVKQPPKTALKQIQGGRLSGKTDINPQWRYQVMTEQFGICGIGWRYEVARLWTEPAPEDQVFAFAQVNLYVKVGDKWSEAIPGIGGHMLAEKESRGLHANDEGFKMAITDALGTAMKMIGVAADIYAGLWDGSRYKEEAAPAPHATQPKAPTNGKANLAPATMLTKLNADRKAMGYSDEAMKSILQKRYKIDSSTQLTKPQAEELIDAVSKGKGVDDNGEWI